MIETKEVILTGSPNYEEKIFRDMYYECKNYINDLTAFGWQPTQETSRRSGRSTHHYQIMARETTMPHYNEYRKFENDYETAKDEIKYYEPMEVSTVFLLLLILIIPGVLYVAYKLAQKASIESDNQQCKARMQKAVLAARNLNKGGE